MQDCKRIKYAQKIRHAFNVQPCRLEWQSCTTNVLEQLSYRRMPDSHNYSSFNLSTIWKKFRGRAVHRASLEETILKFMINRPDSSSRSVADNGCVYQLTIWKVLNKIYFPLSFSTSAKFELGRLSSALNFCLWVLQQYVFQQNFTVHIVLISVNLQLILYSRECVYCSQFPCLANR